MTSLYATWAEGINKAQNENIGSTDLRVGYQGETLRDISNSFVVAEDDISAADAEQSRA